MIRKIIKIEKDLCNGCGLCVTACHEGAIKLIDGKATLTRDDYCDGLGDCLPVCPTNAISFEEREALAYDEKAVLENKGNRPLACGCPGTHSHSIERKLERNFTNKIVNNTSCLNQWPVQIQLVPVNAPYFNNANLLIAADCTAYAYANIHNDFMKNRITLIGCPKLDNEDYSVKLTNILSNNNIKSITVLKMDVPCCGGLENAVIRALKICNKMIPWQVHTITVNGKIKE